VKTSRVALTFYSDAEYFGGAEGYLSLLAAYLDRDRFDLSIVLPSCPGALVLEERMRALKVAIHHLERPGFAWLRKLPGMVRALSTVSGDILHMNLPSSYDAGVSAIAWAARQAGYKRVVSTEHLPMIERKYKKFPIKIFFTHWVDEIIVNTRSNREFLVQLHGMDREKIRIVENGVEEVPPYAPDERARLRAEWGAGPATVVIGIVGRLTRRKGHHYLLRALSELEDETAPWILVVAGEGEEGDALRRQASELGLGARAVWLGHREDAPRLMHAFDLLTLPSTVETMPFAIIEGMAARLPVVASAIYGIPELIVPEETGFLIAARDVAALRARLHQLIGDRGLRLAMGAKGRARFESRFSAARMAEATSRVYLGRPSPEASDEVPVLSRLG
jgi:glycosyltransferase involved in cell wall biosynthesis